MERRDQVLMIDVRNIFRKVTRKIYDFTPEQQQNLTAIVWLYRGESDRFVGLVQQYLERTLTEAAAITEKSAEFRLSYDAIKAATAPFLKTLSKNSPLRETSGNETTQPKPALTSWMNSTNGLRKTGRNQNFSLSLWERAGVA